MTWTNEDAALFGVVDAAVAGHPRSGQRAVGPSGLGVPCDRALTFALAGQREDRLPLSGWQTAVGTAVHTWMEGVFQAENRRLGRVRYVTEVRVNVGSYAGRDVWGTSDLFDVDTLTVYDWKTASASSMRRHRANLGQQYLVQLQAYGRGWETYGVTPKFVADAFVPRDGQLGNAFVHREPYDPTVVVDALARAERLQGVLDTAGSPEAASEGLPDCGVAYCSWCRATRTPASMFA